MDNHKVNVEYTKIITEVASLSVSYKKQTYELGWLSYLSNILSPSLAKSGGQKIFCSLRSQKLPPRLSKPWAVPRIAAIRNDSETEEREQKSR